MAIPFSPGMLAAAGQKAKGLISTPLNIAQGIRTARQGKKQMQEGERIRAGLIRPEYEMPEELRREEDVALATQMAATGLPEAQKAQYLQNLQRGTTTGLAALGSRKAGLSGLATLNEQQNQGYATMLAQDAAARQANQQNLINLRGQVAANVAAGKDQEFQTNVVNPYYEGLAEAQGLIGAGMQNRETGIGNIFNAFMPKPATQPTTPANVSYMNPMAAQTTQQPTVGVTPPGITDPTLQRGIGSSASNFQFS